MEKQHSAQLSLLKLWLGRADALHLNVIVIALDAGVVDYCRESKRRCLYDASWTTSAGDMRFKHHSFMAMGLVKFKWVRRLVL